MKHESPLVRAAEPEDFLQIMDLCRKLYAENGAVNVSWLAVEAAIIDAVNGFGASIGVVGPVGAIEGMIYLRISKMWYSEETILEEMFNYVPPDHRKGKNSQALITFAKNAAHRFNVPLLIGIISNNRTKAKIRHYTQQLGEPAGAFFLYNAKTGGR